MKRDLAELMKRAEAAGAVIDYTASGHYRVVAPNGKIIICPRTPSDWRALRNVRANLRREGLDV